MPSGLVSVVQVLQVCLSLYVPALLMLEDLWPVTMFGKWRLTDKQFYVLFVVITLYVFLKEH